MKLSELLDTAALDDLIAHHYIRERSHPTLPLAILNYTAKTQAERRWTRETELCRGLIVDASTGDIVSRPFRKFFNIGERPGQAIPDETFVAYEKVDGSLGISYPAGDGRIAIATRGSFTSPQARRATDLLHRRYPGAASGMQEHPEYTFLFEIVLPENRIVVDYGATEELVLLAVVNRQTGREVPLPELAQTNWTHHFRWPTTWEYPSLDAAMDAVEGPDFSGAEGVVVRFASGLRLKIKREEYKRLHRIVTGLTPRRIHEMLAKDSATTIARLFIGTPEGFQDWARPIVLGLRKEHEALLTRAHAEYERIMGLVLLELNVRPGFAFHDATTRASIQRAHFAAHATKTTIPDLLFSLYDGRSPSAAAWKRLRPAAADPFRVEE